MARRIGRTTLWAGAGVIALAGVALAATTSVRGEDRAEGRAVSQADASSELDVPHAIDENGTVDLAHPAFPDALVTAEEIRSGGPPPDGIPAIDDPTFLDVDEVDFLDAREPVLTVEINGDARAYPIQVMIWHEIVNDTVGGQPVAATYCPLCNSAFVWSREVSGSVVTFGTSGKLWNSSLVMYDRQSRSLWGHFTGEAIGGHFAGTQLEPFPASIVSWEDFAASRPDGLVLSRDTGVSRRYGDNPYPGYDDVDNPPFLFDGNDDGRLAAKERVIGVERDGDAVAVTFAELSEREVVPLDVGGGLVAVWSGGTSSALDSATVADGRDIGSTNVFEATLDGEALDLAATGDGTFTSSDGTTWDVLGHGVDGPRRGANLQSVTHVDTFWFAWSTFQPDTRLIGGTE